MNNGFFLCLPDAQSLRVLHDCILPFDSKTEDLHMSALVINDQIEHVQAQFADSKLTEIELKNPLCAKVRGIGSLSRRDGKLLTVLHLEALPCTKFKLQLVCAT